MNIDTNIADSIEKDYKSENELKECESLIKTLSETFCKSKLQEVHNLLEENVIIFKNLRDIVTEVKSDVNVTKYTINIQKLNRNLYEVHRIYKELEGA
mmetsp:Transcript_10146/g.9095  ORF Transcript_10146/g.9095 Transcript_10146/m.9095 type:complete len:98 (+) Transcript_10146:126-419(+)